MGQDIISRIDAYLACALNETTEVSEPISRVDHFLVDIALMIKLGGNIRYK